MANIGDKLQAGASVDYSNSTTNTTDTHTIKGNYKAQLMGFVSAGAARITINPGGSLTHTKFLDLDFAADVTDLVIKDVQLQSGDEVKLVLDSGATGYVAIRLLHPQES